eukprot:scaffold73897_cov37-Phaeocystis_antarctica.AAC.1
MLGALESCSGTSAPPAMTNPVCGRSILDSSLVRVRVRAGAGARARARARVSPCGLWRLRPRGPAYRRARPPPWGPPRTGRAEASPAVSGGVRLGLGLGLRRELELGARASTLRNSALDTMPLLSTSHSLNRSTMRTALFVSDSLI